MHLALKKYWNSTHLVKYNNLTINMIGLDTNIFLCISFYDLTLTATQHWHHAASSVCWLNKPKNQVEQISSVALPSFSGCEQWETAAVMDWWRRTDMPKYLSHEQLKWSLCHTGLLWCDKEYGCPTDFILWMSLQSTVSLLLPLSLKAGSSTITNREKLWTDEQT